MTDCAKYMLILSLFGTCFACENIESWQAPLRPNLEEVMSNGARYNPSTQSFLRGHHWLDSATDLKIELSDSYDSRFLLKGPGSEHTFEVKGLSFDLLLPRLHYRPQSPPDDFDAFNLMMAEYSRNGMSVPRGHSGDTMSHFETSLEEESPWSLKGDFEFVPNGELLPLRFAVVNNCLTPGLWELSATDRAGEIYHSWFDMPEEPYFASIAKVNGVSPEFAKSATQWKTESVALDLDRLRIEGDSLGAIGVQLAANERAGFSSQGSRRKLERKYAFVDLNGQLEVPQNWRQILNNPVHLSEFVAPGVYAQAKRRIFNLGFLGDPKQASLRRVTPLTDYTVDDGNPPADLPNGYVELEMQLGDRKLIVGNLPLDLLVPAEEFVINGFGVGILSASDFAERRSYLLSQGPSPSFAYIVEEKNGKAMAMNSHELGIEQLFIRTHLEGSTPWWEITITSYERIVDLVRYRVEVPKSLHRTLFSISEDYVSPIYYTYRDDNLR